MARENPNMRGLLQKLPQSFKQAATKNCLKKSDFSPPPSKETRTPNNPKNKKKLDKRASITESIVISNKFQVLDNEDEKTEMETDDSRNKKHNAEQKPAKRYQTKQWPPSLLMQPPQSRETMRTDGEAN
ncbi:hypothetical protein JTB14_025479 [Gonioctena quinquepunctata]|nr:hypothetical protein JTB14_025479 [Gonioctena quinquepunctata]